MPAKKIIKKKKAGKKVAKKVGRLVPKKAPKKSAKPVGVVTHYYGGIKVGIFKFSKPIKAGTSVFIKGATTGFVAKLSSLQYNHKEISRAPKGKQVGVKLSKRVRVGDKVFEN